MTQPLILWADFTASTATAGICTDLKAACRVHSTADTKELPRLVKELMPDIICFDFDYPEPSALRLLQEIKQRHPSIPVLMLTADHSRELLIWVLRARVWDCFLKPVAAAEVLHRLDIMLTVLDQRHRQTPRSLLMPEQRPAGFADPLPATPTQGKTAMALPYILQHYHGKIALPDVARMCSMNPFEFSRTFKREQGITFRDYLTGVRIKEAARLLRTASPSVIEVACAVGFNDHSQFSRLFRRHMGVTPRAYRNGINSRDMIPTQTSEASPAN